MQIDERAAVVDIGVRLSGDVVAQERAERLPAVLWFVREEAVLGHDFLDVVVVVEVDLAAVAACRGFLVGPAADEVCGVAVDFFAHL